jgi:hypothetical protein
MQKIICQNFKSILPISLGRFWPFVGLLFSSLENSRNNWRVQRDCLRYTNIMAKDKPSLLWSYTYKTLDQGNCLCYTTRTVKQIDFSYRSGSALLWPRGKRIVLVRPKIKFCLFPLSDRPTEIAATQKILLPHLMKNYFF